MKRKDYVGNLTKEEIFIIMHELKNVAESGENIIGIKDITKIYGRLGYDMREIERDRLLQVALLKTNVYAISFEEFFVVFNSKLKSLSQKEQIKKSFKIISEEGEFTKKDLKDLMKEIANKETQEEVEELVSLAKVNRKTGYVDLDAFVESLYDVNKT